MPFHHHAIVEARVEQILRRARRASRASRDDHAHARASPSGFHHREAFTVVESLRREPLRHARRSRVVGFVGFEQRGGEGRVAQSRQRERALSLVEGAARGGGGGADDGHARVLQDALEDTVLPEGTV